MIQVTCDNIELASGFVKALIGILIKLKDKLIEFGDVHQLLDLQVMEFIFEI